MTIGVAGKYCSGKDTLVEFLAKAGFDIIDVDKLGHQVLKDREGEIIRAFGRQILTQEGEIDRTVLGRLIFQRAKHRKTLESIVHPEMVRRVKNSPVQRNPRVVINAAILFRMGLHTLCDTIICVSAPFLTRLKRAVERDSLHLWVLIRRLLSQKRICSNFHGMDVDIYSVRNSGSKKELELKVHQFLKIRSLLPK